MNARVCSNLERCCRQFVHSLRVSNHSSIISSCKSRVKIDDGVALALICWLSAGWNKEDVSYRAIFCVLVAHCVRQAYLTISTGSVARWTPSTWWQRDVLIALSTSYATNHSILVFSLISVLRDSGLFNSIASVSACATGCRLGCIAVASLDHCVAFVQVALDITRSRAVTGQVGPAINSIKYWFWAFITS